MTLIEQPMIKYPSLHTLLSTSKSQIQTSASSSISNLKILQNEISSLSVFSRNETMEDVSTINLPLLLVEYYLGLAYLALSTSSSKERDSNLKASKEYLHSFMQKMEILELFKEEDDSSSTILQDYHRILDKEEENNSIDTDTHNNNKHKLYSFEITREEKINRFRKKRDFEHKLQFYQSLQERRTRLDIQPHEDMDGYDDENLMRSMNIILLKEASYEALDEMLQIYREMEMLQMAVEYETTMARPPHSTHDRRRQNPKPLEVTRINHDPKTGQLILQKEQIKSQVFQTSWNQPTMTLAEYGDREMQAAVERSHHQKIAEEEALLAPRRYEQLVNDGLEDDDALVEQSAVIDRRWDDFKEQNPRGSGNKMANRGDRNF